MASQPPPWARSLPRPAAPRGQHRPRLAGKTAPVNDVSTTAVILPGFGGDRPGPGPGPPLPYPVKKVQRQKAVRLLVQDAPPGGVVERRGLQAGGPVAGRGADGEAAGLEPLGGDAVRVRDLGQADRAADRV